jgi:hypothetical protein
MHPDVSKEEYLERHANGRKERIVPAHVFIILCDLDHQMVPNLRCRLFPVANLGGADANERECS